MLFLIPYMQLCQRLLSSMLLRIFFSATAALADNSITQHYLRGKYLIVLRTGAT